MIKYRNAVTGLAHHHFLFLLLCFFNPTTVQYVTVPLSGGTYGNGKAYWYTRVYVDVCTRVCVCVCTQKGVLCKNKKTGS